MKNNEIHVTVHTRHLPEGLYKEIDSATYTITEETEPGRIMSFIQCEGRVRFKNLKQATSDKESHLMEFRELIKKVTEMGSEILERY